jgi:hypothetical protein
MTLRELLCVHIISKFHGEITKIAIGCRYQTLENGKTLTEAKVGCSFYRCKVRWLNMTRARIPTVPHLLSGSVRGMQLHRTLALNTYTAAEEAVRTYGGRIINILLVYLSDFFV